MCDDASELREWRFHIRDMITFSENVLSYSSGMNQDEFLADNITYRNLLAETEKDHP